MSGPTLLLLFSQLNPFLGVGLSSALAVRENVIRLTFTGPVTFTGLGDAQDSSVAAKYAVVPVAGTSGLDGNPTQPVSVIGAAAVDGVPAAVDVTLDRPMSPYPAQYVASAAAVYVNSIPSTSQLTFLGVHRQINPPDLDFAKPLKDMANPQTAQQATGAGLPMPAFLATFPVDDTGDYAIDQGVQSLRKRIFRRLTAKKNSFLHLAGYGLGASEYAKRLNLASTRATLAAEAEAQVSREPEVAKVIAAVVSDPDNRGVAYLRLLVKTRDGQSLRLTAPLPLSG